MRRLAFIILATACVRPVLYYPTPESAGLRASSDSAAGPTVNSTPTGATNATTTASGDADNRVPLMIGAGRIKSSTTRSSDEAYLISRHILLPVAGADPSQIQDSFNEGRDGDRKHRAIDILAPRGTPILSADDGRILRMSKSSLGGITMYTIDADARLVFYYAHMDRYNKAMHPGQVISRGDTLGYVGTTGNAPKNVPHLHFQVMRWADDGKYWDGEPIDPYEALGGLPHVSKSNPGSSPKR